MGARTDTRAITTLAADQHGLVTLAQLRTAGATRAVVTRLARDGWLHRVHPGVYAAGHPGLSPVARCLAASLSTDGAVSHFAAAWLWGLTGPPAAIDVTVPTGRRPTAPGLVVHRRALLAREVTRRGGVPCTSLIRTLIDLASVVTAPELERLFDEAQVVHHLSPVDVAVELLMRRGHRGSARLARIVDDAVEPGQIESHLELGFLKLCRDFGLPRPLTQVRMGRWRVDFWFREQRVVVEADSRRFHSTLRRRRRDARKTADLEGRGETVLRVTWWEVTETPEAVAARVGAALNARVA